MKLLVITSLFPNREEPQRGIFNRRQLKALARRLPLRIMAPVPWAPPGLPRLMPAWALLWQLFNSESGWLWQMFNSESGLLRRDKFLLVVFGATILGLQVWMMIEGLLVWRRARGVLEETLPPLPATQRCSPDPDERGETPTPWSLQSCHGRTATSSSVLRILLRLIRQTLHVLVS